MYQTEETYQFIIRSIVGRLASAIGSTEVAVFAVQAQKEGQVALDLIHHLRAGDWSDDVIERALAEFRKLVEHAIRMNANAAFDFGDNKRLLVVRYADGGAPRAALAAFIPRATQEEAVERLRVLEGHDWRKLGG